MFLDAKASREDVHLHYFASKLLLTHFLVLLGVQPTA